MKMKKKLKKAILILILIATTIACIYVMSKNDIIKIKDKWLSKENILNLNEYSTQVTNITTYDVTGLVTGAETSHDCNKYSTSKYDDNYHWTECTICGKILEAKEKHIKVKSDYSYGYASCYPDNKYTISCSKGCGYSETKNDPHPSYTGWKTDRWAYNQYEHYDACSVCNNWIKIERCKDSKGNLITCKNLGTCKDCKHQYTKDNARHHIDNTGKCLICNDRNKIN